MKKTTKKIITIIGCVILAISLAFNVFLGLECGILGDTSSLAGSVNESWKMNDANITSHVLDTNRYYSSDGDYITDVCLHDETGGKFTISYDTEFSTFDDLEVYFVLTNSTNQKYTTPVEKSHIPTGGDSVSFTVSNDISLNGLHITEIWVRTID